MGGGMTKLIMLCHTPSWKTLRAVWSVLRNTEDVTLTIVRTKHSCARNRAIGMDTLKLAEGEHFVMMDDDVIVRPGWLDALRKYATGGVGMVSAPLRNPWLFTRLRHLKRSFRRSNRVTGPVENIVPAVILCRYAYGVKPDCAYGGSQREDTDLIMQYKSRGYTLYVSPDTWFYHSGGKIASNRTANTELFIRKWGVNPDDGFILRPEGLIEKTIDYLRRH